MERKISCFGGPGIPACVSVSTGRNACATSSGAVMRPLFFAAVFASAAIAQPIGPVVPATGGEMPGKPVGQASVQPVGTRLPTVGKTLPKVGTPLGEPGGPNNPFGGEWPTSIDPNLVIAPYPGQKNPTADFWDRLQDRWAKLFPPSAKPPSTYIPGLTRRNRERREREQALLERRMRD